MMIFLPSGSEMKTLELVEMFWCPSCDVTSSLSWPLPVSPLHNTNSFLPTLTYLHLHCVQLVPQLQLVGDLVDRGQAPSELVTDLLQRSRHLGWVHGGVHPDNSVSATSSDLNFFTAHELCRARKNIAASRIRRIFIWKSWKILIP